MRYYGMVRWRTAEVQRTVLSLLTAAEALAALCTASQQHAYIPICGHAAHQPGPNMGGVVRGRLRKGS